MFLLQVTCGRRPTILQDVREHLFLANQVYSSWKRGAILKADNPELEGNYDSEEIQQVLKLGLLTSDPKAEASCMVS